MGLGRKQLRHRIAHLMVSGSSTIARSRSPSGLHADPEPAKDADARAVVEAALEVALGIVSVIAIYQQLRLGGIHLRNLLLNAWSPKMA